MVATESAVSAASAVVTVSGNTVEISITDLSYFQFGVIFEVHLYGHGMRISAAKERVSAASVI